MIKLFKIGIIIVELNGFYSNLQTVCEVIHDTNGTLLNQGCTSINDCTEGCDNDTCVQCKVPDCKGTFSQCFPSWGYTYGRSSHAT